MGHPHTITVTETKITKHTIVVTDKWPKDKKPELYLSEVIENVGFDCVHTLKSEVIEREIHGESGSLIS